MTHYSMGDGNNEMDTDNIGFRENGCRWSVMSEPTHCHWVKIVDRSIDHFKDFLLRGVMEAEGIDKRRLPHLKMRSADCYNR